MKKVIELYNYLNINDLSLLLNINNNEIINICKDLGIIVNINTILEKELILLISDELGYKVKFLDSLLLNEKEKIKIYKKNIYIKRSPIVSIMGHVNHGKTSFLDYIRKSNINIIEEGNITQHIGIYNVNLKPSITFIDTPGHESFLSIRRISIKLSDIALIIISSENGVMEQTIEAINNAKSDNLPIIFGISKIDKNNNINKIKEQLSNINILVDDWGGEYLYQKISVKTGYGINEIIKKILNLTKKKKLFTNINKLCTGKIIYSYINKNKGYIVRILVLEGILKRGYYIISGIYYGKIKEIIDENNININVVYPGLSVNIVGFNGVPYTGDDFKVLKNEIEIKQIVIDRKNIIKEQEIKIKKKLYKKNKNKKKKINIILKVDVENSLLAIIEEINKLNIDINIIKKKVGNIKYSDYLLANTFNCIIIGFNVKNIINKKKINNKNIEIYNFKVIYNIIKLLINKNKNKNKENIKILGKAKVIKIFIKDKILIMGCKVINGKINKFNKIRIIRNNKIILISEIISIKIFNKNVNEVKKNNEFGLIINNKEEIKVNDIIENIIVNNKNI
ncbi:translation initiation factor IF-2 N-terminal domain-containing protein [Candidatus Shikimatogenerans bostrichidophilus]|uniref:translation initiation factor IF-2 N-terminal domain-containing protein n=1 Tax=Candidatus Shikimatogenerans bostrichidophilus TaxID=2943807 RepID=UPI002966B889